MRGSYLLICAILLAVVVLLNLPLPASMRLRAATRDGVAPFQNVMSLVLHKGLNMFTFVSRARDAVDEKETMLSEIARLRTQLKRSESLRRDNDELRKMVAFRRRQPHELRLCEVVTRGGASGWWQTVTINRGRNDRLVPNLTVITTKGLVGRIGDTSRRTSTVLLITDPACKVACRISRTGAFGVVKGTGVAFNGDRALEMLCAVQPLDMEYISRDHELRRDDVAVTSGLGGVFPEGLVVGRVLDASADPSGLYQRAALQPAADLAALRYVFVIEQ